MRVSGLNYRLSPPHQKRGDASLPCTSPMRSGARPRGTPRVRLSRTLPRAGTLLVLLAVVAVLSVSSARAAYAGQGSQSYGWTNGTVMCVFSPTLPAVTVSATALNGTGIAAALGQITEESPSGVPIATAVPTTIPWEPVNASSSEWLTMNYSQFVSVTNATNPSQSLGPAWVSVSFALNQTPPNATLADVVAFQLSIQGWPWHSPSDTFALSVLTWSAYSASEHMVVSSPSSPRVESVNNSNGHAQEYFEAGLTATTGTGAVLAVTPHTVLAGGIATTTLTLGPGAGGASAVTYQATLGITPSTPVLGLPLYDYLAVAGGAGLVALVVGVGTRRVREEPSDLTYVEEAE
jgi:hypothetical protein